MSSTHVDHSSDAEKALGQPFHPAVIERAHELAAHYEIRIARNGGAGYVGRVTELPAVAGHGQTDAEALRVTRELLQWAIAYLIEKSRPVPTPRS
jgi:predicted RNase H-like HicB family nuclease